MRRQSIYFRPDVSPHCRETRLEVRRCSELQQRLVTIGLDILERVVVVCWTTRDDDIRIFSAREATRRERAMYEQGE